MAVGRISSSPGLMGRDESAHQFSTRSRSRDEEDARAEVTMRGNGSNASIVAGRRLTHGRSAHCRPDLMPLSLSLHYSRRSPAILLAGDEAAAVLQALASLSLLSLPVIRSRNPRSRCKEVSLHYVLGWVVESERWTFRELSARIAWEKLFRSGDFD